MKKPKKSNRQDSGTRIAALADALNQSPVKAMVDDLDQFLDLAEPWLARDILRAHLLAGGDPPPGAHYILAFVRERGRLLGPSGWTLMPPAMSGTRPVRCLVVGTPGPVYDMALTENSGLVIGVWAEWIRLSSESAENPPAMVEWISRKIDAWKKKTGS